MIEKQTKAQFDPSGRKRAQLLKSERRGQSLVTNAKRKTMKPGADASAAAALHLQEAMAMCMSPEQPTWTQQPSRLAIDDSALAPMQVEVYGRDDENEEDNAEMKDDLSISTTSSAKRSQASSVNVVSTTLKRSSFDDL